MTPAALRHALLAQTGLRIGMSGETPNSEQEDAIWNLYREVRPTDILQQGDLIRFSSTNKKDRYGVVVTADCDLDKRKHSRLVTLVPLVSVEEIICKCLSFDAFETYSPKLKEYCRTSLGIDVRSDDSHFLAEVTLKLRAGEIAQDEAELAARIVLHEDIEISVVGLRTVLTAAGVEWPKVIDRLRNQLKSRGDLLALSTPPLSDSDARVAWLRPMWQEHVSSIAIRTSESVSRSGLRIAQLNSPYRYRLTQMLGQVFSDIGLPDVSAKPIEDVLIGLKE